MKAIISFCMNFKRLVWLLLKLVFVRVIIIAVLLLSLVGQVDAVVNNSCLTTIKSKFNEIEKVKVEHDIKNIENNQMWLNAKASLFSNNYRVYQCRLEDVCLSLQSYMLSSWKNPEPSNNSSVEFIWCGWDKIDLTDFSACLSVDTSNILDVYSMCNKERSIYSQRERVRVIREFEMHSTESKSDFLSAKLLSMNNRMRELHSKMFKLRNYLNDIVNKLTCLQK